MTVLDPALAADDAGRVSDRERDRPDPEVPEPARRRTFTAAYKIVPGRSRPAASLATAGLPVC